MKKTVRYSDKLLHRFEGCLVGAVVGDCYGSEFEGTQDVIPFSDLDKYNKKRIQNIVNKKKKSDFLLYTDDSCMTLDIAKTLVKPTHMQNGQIDKYRLIEQFSNTYFEPRLTSRGYGGNIGNIFKAVQQSNFTLDPFKVAASQFNGQGSFGNGSAMRTSPVALFDYQNIENVVLNSYINSLTTHFNADAVIGSLIQSLSINKLLSVEDIDSQAFVTELQNDLVRCLHLHTEEVKDLKLYNTYESVYNNKLFETQKLLQTSSLQIHNKVINALGNGIQTSESVVTALFAFLYSLEKINFKNLSTDMKNDFFRTIMFAVSLGGDTDTIASMAGALAGTYYGINNIPSILFSACEGTELAKNLANELFISNKSDNV